MSRLQVLHKMMTMITAQTTAEHRQTADEKNDGIQHKCD